MAKKLKKDDSMINKIYLWILGVITGLFVVGLVFVILDVVLPNDFSRIDNISVNELQNKKVNNNITEFYVLVYTSSNDENELIAAQIAGYDEYVDSTKTDADETNDGVQIFKIEFNEKNKDVLGKMVLEADCPCLIKISSGAIEYTKSTVSTILEELQTAQK